jgi:arginyl-tRNA synthetase
MEVNMFNTIKQTIKNEIENYILKQYNQEVEVTVEKPKNSKLGDISVPVFSMLKVLRKPLPKVIDEIKAQLNQSKMIDYFDEISNVSGFINIRFNKVNFSKEVLDEYQKADDFGRSDLGEGKTIVMDYSSPNIAKPFSVGHLRSTVIGNAIGNILEKLGYKVVRINHLGDFGTQFGKIIYAYLNFGDKEAVEKNPIEELMKLYVEFHELAKENPELEDKAREIFKELEQNNPEYVSLWKHFRQVSLEEYMKVYDLLNVYFDSYDGEAFYNDKMQAIVDELKEKDLLVKDQGAMIVQLDGDIPPALIQKRDGSTLYITRDLAALFYRKNTYDFDEALYVVGNEQKLHFTQLQEVCKKMGYDFYEDIHHINFGLVLQDGKKMSTRKGKIVKLIDVLDEAVQLSLNYINEKNPDLEDKEEIAKHVGVSAIIFNDLKNYRANDIEFNLEDMVNFTGQTGPYLQYTSVRITSMLKENFEEAKTIDFSILTSEPSFELIKTIDEYEDVLVKAKEEYSPSVLAKYLLNLASLFNSYYAKEKVMVDDDVERQTKLLLISIVRNILDDGMNLLGMKVIQKM